MNLNFSTDIINIEDKKLKLKIKKVLNKYLKESLKGNKVAFYYEDINNSTILSFNQEKCFYAASSIKIIVCLLMFEKALKNEIDLNKEILITKKDLKQGTGIIKLQEKDTKYSLLELIKLCIVESDNTAYLKLVNLIGKEKLAEYGRSLGAKHTMEGKETDSFGIINCQDMIIYWKKIIEFINKKNKYSLIFEEFLTSTTTKLINEKIFAPNKFLRKYGSYGIAYHEAGYVNSENPYYLIILSQLNKCKYKEKFLNYTAKIINEIHKYINSK